MDHLSKEWALKSLTIGPQSNETNAEFWEEAFRGLPPLPSVDNVTIIYNYSTARAFNTDCWEYFDRMLTHRELFPTLKSVYIQSGTRSQRLSPRRLSALFDSLHAIRSRNLWPRRRFSPLSFIYPNGVGLADLKPRKLLAFEQEHRTDLLTKRRSVVMDYRWYRKGW